MAHLGHRLTKSIRGGSATAPRAMCVTCDARIVEAVGRRRQAVYQVRHSSAIDFRTSSLQLMRVDRGAFVSLVGGAPSEDAEQESVDRSVMGV